MESVISKMDEKLRKEIEEKIVPKYRTRRSACMATMQLVQSQKGHLTKEDMEEIAALLGMQPVEVEAVGKFYTMYNVERPVGRYHIQVCENLSCSLMGGEHILKHIERLLGIKTGETTSDKKFTLSTVQCLGSCGTAPVIQINDDYYENLNEKKVEEILGKLR